VCSKHQSVKKHCLFITNSVLFKCFPLVDACVCLSSIGNFVYNEILKKLLLDIEIYFKSTLFSYSGLYRIIKENKEFGKTNEFN
jgi:hypothetical protein